MEEMLYKYLLPAGFSLVLFRDSIFRQGELVHRRCMGLPKLTDAESETALPMSLSLY